MCVCVNHKFILHALVVIYSYGLRLVLQETAASVAAAAAAVFVLCVTQWNSC